MPALYEQLPSKLDIVVTHGDALTIKRSLGFNTTGDTLTAVVYEDTPAGYAAAIAATPAPAASWTVTVVAAATGDVTLSLAANTVKSLSLAKSYRWFIRSALLNRAVESGTFAVRAP
ncbi:MAG: hypothetical protein KGR24_03280 [Planctomycetes bacterium]|nr:hypothetical protein [Planctomycetota bacterium]